MRSRRLSTRGSAIVAFVVAQIVGTSIYAFAASGPEWAHQASAPVTGLQVSDVDYELDRANPYMVERVTFRVERLPGGSTIHVGLSPNAEWVTCHAAGTSVSCKTPGTTAESVTHLSVVIGD